MTDLRTARKSAGKSQEELASLTGLGQPDLSKLESGQMPMTEGVGERLARHLPGTTPSALVIGNLTAGYKRARERGDKIGVLEAAKSVVKYAAKFDSDPTLDAALDQLTEAAIKFAQGTNDYVSDDGRDVLGRRVTKASAAPSDEGDWPLAPWHQTPDVDLEDLEEREGVAYGEGDGRDIHGFRIAPLSDVEDEEE